MGIFSKPEFVWLIVAIICFVIEAITLNLTTIWFGFGAIASMILASFGGSTSFQIVLFATVTLLLIIFAKPISVKYIKKTSINIKKLVGKSAIVTEKIDNIKGTGKIKIDRNIWPAQNENSLIIDEKEVVDVIATSGEKLVVKIKGM